MAPYPVAQPFEPLSLFRSYGAVRARADVEQQVSSHADRLREVPHELPHGFVVHILWPVAPGVVDGQAQLPVGLRRRHRQALLGRGVVAVAEQPGVAHRVGCQITDQPRQFGHPPLLGRALPLAVEPEQIRSEPGEQLAHLAVPVVEVALPGPRVLGARGGGDVGAVDQFGMRWPGVPYRCVVRMVPVGVRVVQTGPEAPVAHRAHVLGNQVASRGGTPDHAQVAQPRFPQGHSVVVPCRQHGVAGPGAREEPGPSGGIEGGGGEAVELAHVLLVRHHLVEKGPGLGYSVDRVDAVVHEYAQLRLVEPGLHGHGGPSSGTRGGHVPTNSRRSRAGDAAILTRPDPPAPTPASERSGACGGRAVRPTRREPARASASGRR